MITHYFTRFEDVPKYLVNKQERELSKPDTYSVVCDAQATGLDPLGIKVRASKGLAAVDYFLPGYHVWAHVIEALSDFGYDLNNMVKSQLVKLQLKPGM